MTSDILANVRVLEAGEGIAVPYCGKLLADFGADVIKIEKPGEGDRTRQHGPFPEDVPHPERSGLFLALNTNKRGITLDPGLPTGRQVLEALVHTADVILHQTTPDMAEAHLFQAEALRRDDPRLVVTGVTPYGQFGPYSGDQGTELTSCALSGLSEGLGENDRPPLAAPFSQAGYQAGLSAASATVLALLVREMSGQGQAIDIAEADVLATLQTGVYLNNYHFDGTRSMRGHRFGSRTIYPASFYRCRDGFMWVTAPQWAQWERLLAMIGRPDLAEDERFHNRRRMADNPPPELDVPLAQWFMAHTRAEIFHQCREARLPIAPVYHIDELIAHPQLAARGFLMAVERPEISALRLPGLPMQLSKTPWRVRLPAPLLGEHNVQLYCDELGYDRSELTAWRQSGVA
ncbi:CaiB/BaiF CoA transferase family protein [Candidatus Entotheonella palauensis]|uniref:CaiB/BaiF CoA transferase family protein n=1 Tax=Candidatus Entotheonella palauensis TaxID=93172 RepID=UPI000B7D8F11|nr:CoA transferase [Candidatus Entotheonella palauensis]